MPPGEVGIVHRMDSQRRGATAPMMTLLVLALVAAPAAAEPADSASARPAAERTRLYLGMWSAHVRDLGRGVDGNGLLGIAWRGYYAATFINSYGDRAVAAGIQRSFTAPRDGAFTKALGYRAGLVTGYDERFFGVGDKVPALPFAQLVGSVDYHNVGVELAYAGVVGSLVVNWRL
jgi:hypothetical protein